MTPSQYLELFVSLSVQVALIVIVAHWASHLADREQTVCRVWLVCHGAIVAVVLAAVLLPHPRLVRPWSALHIETTTAIANFEERAGQVLFAVWLTGLMAASAGFVVQLILTQRFLARCRPIASEMPEFELTRFIAAADVPSGAPIEVLTSPSLSSPFCWQFHRPVIVLPETLLALEPGDLQRILRHEIEHLRTGHPLHLFLQRAVEAVFWFHPMVWWASHQATLAREFACDDAAADSNTEIADYLRTLLTVVELGYQRVGNAGVSLDFGRGRSIIAARAQRLVRRAQNPVARRGSGVVPLTVGIALMTLLIALAWLPIDVLASARSGWSPWPTWTAQTLHDFGIDRPDFETYDRRSLPFELSELDARRSYGQP